MVHDNPADRLLNIILEGKKHQLNEKCREVWQQILGTNDEPTLLMRLGLAAALPRQVINALQETTLKRGPTWNHWHPQIVSAFTAQQLNGPWSTFIGTIDQHSIDALRASAELLELRSPKSLIEPAKLDELKVKLTEVLKEVRDSTEIDAALKKTICKAILEIINAIDQYLLKGIDGIAEALEGAAGAVARNADAREFVKEDGLGQKVLSLLKWVNKTVDSAEKVKELGEDVHDGLEWLDLIP